MSHRRIFVSHASENDEVATALVEGLARRGLSTFVDHHPRTGIIPGEDWLESISRDIRRSRSVLILMSTAWRTSQWCQAEFKVAKLLNKNIIPVAVGDDGHNDVEPNRQKIFITDSVTEETLDAIAGAVPRRIAMAAIVSAAIAAIVALLAAGMERAPFGRWDASPLRGGTFVDLAPDPENPTGLFALASKGWGTLGLFTTSDCGARWSELPLPSGFSNSNRLDVTRDEVLIATDEWVWALNREKNTWKQLTLDGLSSEVLVAKSIPGRPHELAYGTLRGGGMRASSASAMTDDSSAYVASKEAGGTTVVDRRTQERRSFPFQMNDIAFDPISPDRVAIAAGNDGVFYSQDAMKTVREVADYGGGTPLFVAFDHTGETVFVGGGDGLWAFAFPRKPPHSLIAYKVLDIPGEARQLTVLPDGTKLFASTAGFFRSDPGKRRFEAVAAPIEKHVNEVLRCGDRLIAATGSAGLFALSPTSRDWQQVLTSPGRLPAYAGAGADQLRLVAAGPYLFRSVDGGHRFDPVLAPGALATVISYSPPNLATEATDSIQQTLQHRSESTRGSYLYTEGQVIVGLGDGRIFQKPRGSIIWSERVANAGQYPVNTLARSTTRPDMVLATIHDKQPLMSLDGGWTWKSILNVSAEESFTAFALRDGTFLLAGAHGSLRVLDVSSGAISVRRSMGKKPITGFAVAGGTDAVVMADGDGRLYALNKPDGNVIEQGRIPLGASADWIDLYCCDDARIMYAASSHGIFRAGIAGKDWRPLVLELPQDAKIYAAAPDRNGRPAFATDAGYLRPSTEGKLCVTDTSCLSWRASNIGRRIREIRRSIASLLP